MLNTSIDLLDRFSAVQTPEDRWKIANEVFAELGGCGLTYAMVDVRNLIPHWVQSSLSEEWLSEYVEQDYHRVDPFLLDMRREPIGSLAIGGSLSRDTAPSEKALQLNWGFRDAGYTLMRSNLFAGDASHSRKCVTFCTTEDVSHFGEDQVRKIRQASTMVAAFVTPLASSKDDVISKGIRHKKLSGRERQILAELANGNQNTQIAHDLGIAEVTVRKTLLSAREKLGASTREEALAIAVRLGILSL
ncbi:LuxR C-terminal-related transcriptional regulator [Aliisedimentitalea scapharcae]|uniref:LuxR C-terminal-related transcriptional regulator n=1 Tax=Aliisedimentitalea scapharcae TaxID=1524259 RepID=A0ABZ2XWK0_9RHOB|nr:LuxR family transcriptional regulator [Rhodobacteraceae bacterium M382]